MFLPSALVLLLLLLSGMYLFVLPYLVRKRRRRLPAPAYLPPTKATVIVFDGMVQPSAATESASDTGAGTT